MPKYTVKNVTKLKDIPDAKFGSAKVLQLSFEETEECPEWFVKVATPAPAVGSKLEGEIEQSNFGPKWKPAGSQQRGGFQKSPAQEERIVRQHSAEMALMREANLIAAGNRPFTGDELHSVINFFVNDAYGKFKSSPEIDGMMSDVPADETDLPLIRQKDGEAFK